MTLVMAAKTTPDVPEGAPIGATRVRAKMAAAVELAALAGTSTVDAALGRAALAGRFPWQLTQRRHRMTGTMAPLAATSSAASCAATRR